MHLILTEHARSRFAKRVTSEGDTEALALDAFSRAVPVKEKTFKGDKVYICDSPRCGFVVKTDRHNRSSKWSMVAVTVLGPQELGEFDADEEEEDDDY